MTRAALAAERSVASCLPYAQQIDEHTVITHEGDLTQTIVVHGIPYDTLGHRALDGLNRQWLSALHTIAANTHVALWTHVERQRVRYDLSDLRYDNAMSTEFARQYAARFAQEALFVNRLSLSPVFRLGGSRLDRLGLRVAGSRARAVADLRIQARDDLDTLSASLLTALQRYHPRRLGTYEADGLLCSRTAEHYCRLLNNVDRRIALARQELSHSIQAAALNFGMETVEIEGPAGSRYAACLTLVAPYRAEAVDAKVFEGLLSAPFEFVLSQSATVLPFDRADALLRAQFNKIKSTSENPEQLSEVAEARTRLQAGRFSMLEHELVLVVYGDSVGALNAHVNIATSILDRKAMGVARERAGALICTYFSIMPANFGHGRIRAMPVSSANFAKFFPMHGQPQGDSAGSQWGEPIALLKTAAGGPYFFNFHLSRDPLRERGVVTPDDVPRTERDDRSARADRVAPDRARKHRKELGNYKIIGRSGGGKTVLKLALRLLACRQASARGAALKVFSFDKDYGEEICIRAMGGQYFRVAAGQPTGLNLFSMTPSAENCAVILSIASWCAQFGGAYTMTHRDEEDLLRSIRQVYQLAPPDRRFARIRDALPAHREGSLYEALGRWCDGGAFAWVLDSPEDRFDLSGASVFGFDMTDFLDVHEARTPILRYLTHRIGLQAAGSPHIIDIAEAWRALQDPLMRAFIENKGKTVRKEDGVIGLDTQEPSDISRSPLGSTLLSQFPTQFLLPNGEAEEGDYIDGLKLTPREFELIKHTPENSGRFLLKKGGESVLLRLDLSGLDDMLAVLSASRDNVEVMQGLIRDLGPDPARWLPLFFERRI